MQLLAEWSQELEAEGRSPNEMRRLRYAVLRLLTELDRPIASVDEVTETDVVRFLALGIRNKAHSRRMYVEAFREFFGWAAERGHSMQNPAAHLVVPS